MQQSKTASAPGVDLIREQIRAMYEVNPHVRITVQIPHSKVVQDADVTITGVYPHVFCVEELVGGTPQRHTFQYADVITRRVEIGERS